MPRGTRGFTLVELLIVMVVIGVLAAIAIPKFTGSREKAVISALKADLRNLSSLQEIHHSENTTYTTALADLRFVASEAVTVNVVAADASGWSATASHSGTPETCAVYYGDAAAVAPAGTPGVVGCSN